MNKHIFFINLCFFSLLLHAQTISLEPKQDEKKPLWGFVDKNTGKWVVKPSYNVVNSFEQGSDGKYRALVTKGNLQGFLGSDGKPIGPGIVFEKIEPLMEGNNLFVTVKGKVGVINPDGIYIQKPNFTEVSPLGKEGFFVIEKDKKGFLTPEGTTLIFPLYSDIDPSEEGFFIIRKGNKAGLMNRKGDIILEPSKFTGIEKFGDYWKIKNGNKVGLFEASIKSVVVEPKYGELTEPVNFQGGIIYPLKKTNGKWGALNSAGKEVIKFKNQSMTPIPALKAIRVYRNKVGERLFFPEENLFLELSSWSENSIGPFRRLSGRVVVPSEKTPENMILGLSLTEHIKYSDNYQQRKHLFNKLGVNQNFDIIIDREGNLLGTNNVYVKPLGSKWLIIHPSQPWMIYDDQGVKETGTILNGKQFLHSPTQGWYADQSHIIFSDLNIYNFINCGEDLQFMDKDGNGDWIPILKEKPDFSSQSFEKVNPLYENSATVCKNGKWGLFTDGVMKTEIKYPMPLEKSNIGDYLIFRVPDAQGLMSKDGEEILKAEYDSFENSKESGLIDVQQKGYIGLYDPISKNWILPLSSKIKNYEFMNKEGLSNILIYNGKWGLADTNGKIIMPMNYDKNYVLDSLKPKKSVTGSKSTQKKEEPKKKSNTEFQESKQERRF